MSSIPFDSQSNIPIESSHTPHVNTFAFSSYIICLLLKKNVLISLLFVMLITVTTGQQCYIK